MKDRLRYIYGPVRSRRLGRSLGVDLVPYKTCTYDCICCQLGRTTHHTVERKEYVPLQDVVAEVAMALEKGCHPDFITLSGSGEPTLHSRIGEVIREIKRQTATPVAVLTNGSLPWKPEVREALREADVVLPSLDAGTKNTFQRVNRPHPDIAFDRMVQGLMEFRQGFTGQIWLEVFLLEGVTSLSSQVTRIARLAEGIKPDRVQLNTVHRPPTEEEALAVPLDELQDLAALFDPLAEIVGQLGDMILSDSRDSPTSGILDLIRRRPSTLEDIVEYAALSPNEATKRIRPLIEEGLVTVRRSRGRVWYVAANREEA